MKWTNDMEEVFNICVNDPLFYDGAINVMEEFATGHKKENFIYDKIRSLRVQALERIDHSGLKARQGDEVTRYVYARYAYEVFGYELYPYDVSNHMSAVEHGNLSNYEKGMGISDSSIPKGVKTYKQTGESEMKPSDVIKSVTTIFVFGDDASDMTDNQIFDAIKRVEDEIAQLEKISNKPKKLGKRIEDLHNQVNALKEYVDSREDQ